MEVEHPTPPPVRPGNRAAAEEYVRVWGPAYQKFGVALPVQLEDYEVSYVHTSPRPSPYGAAATVRSTSETAADTLSSTVWR